MCGGCGRNGRDWAAPVLGTSYARAVVAGAAELLVPGVRVRSGPHGWTVSDRSGRTDLAASAEHLLQLLARRLRSGSDMELPSYRTLLERGSAAGAHRPMPTRRDQLVSGRVRDLAVGGGQPACPTRVIPAVLTAAVASRARIASAPEGVVLSDDRGAWMLLVG